MPYCFCTAPAVPANNSSRRNLPACCFGPGQLLDVTHYYVILPDNIGHGKSSKPSDGLHAHFPQYDYDDMVAAQHELLEKGLGVNHLRLILGTSMGCMHSWVWGETFPEFMDALMPLACQPVQIAGCNRLWRKMVIDGITIRTGRMVSMLPSLMPGWKSRPMFYIAGAAPPADAEEPSHSRCNRRRG